MKSQTNFIFRYRELQSQLNRTSDMNELSTEIQLSNLQNDYNNLKIKYDKLLQEREEMLQLMQDGSNNTAFDAFKFKKIIEENTDLLKLIEDLKFQLASEKNINHEKLLNLEENVSKVNILNEENNKLQNLKNDILLQLSSQQELFDAKVKQLQSSEQFFKRENEFMKMKQENMVEGITCLKKYMYESMTAEEKSENEHKLATLDKTITNLNKSLEENKQQHQDVIEQFNKNNKEKLLLVSNMIEENLRKINEDVYQGTTSTLSYLSEIQALKQEVESLKKEKAKLKENKDHLQILAEQNKLSTNTKVDVSSPVNIDRVTNVLQKSLDLLMVQKVE